MMSSAVAEEAIRTRWRGDEADVPVLVRVVRV